MPRPDAAKLIAHNLHNLTAPRGGKTTRLLQYSTVGHTPEVAAQITKSAQSAGENIIGLLEANGYTLRHRDDPQPHEQLTKFPTHTVRCKHCTEPILELAGITSDPTRPGHMDSSLHRVAIESAGLGHACWL